MRQAVVASLFLVCSGLVFAQGGGRSGSWFYVIEDDPLDDQPIIKLGSPGLGGQGRMVVFCEGLFTEQIAVDFQSYIGFDADTLKYKFDDEPAVLAPAVTSRNGQAVLFKDRDVFDKMKGHKRLYVRAQSGEYTSSKTLTFGLDGFQQVIAETDPNCTVAL